MLTDRDEFWMQHALKLAEIASQNGEVPVGAVLVLNDEVIGEGFNCPISMNDPTAHAEIVAMRQAAQKINNYRLINTTLYVTLEPCIMCAGAMVHARIKRLVYGAEDQKAGAITSMAHMLNLPYLNHHVEHVGGLMRESCGMILSRFFQARR